jgi:hypothetical protein
MFAPDWYVSGLLQFDWKLDHVMFPIMRGLGCIEFVVKTVGLAVVAAALAGGLVAVGWLDARATNPPIIMRPAIASATASFEILGVFPMISLCVIETDTCTKYISSFMQNA